MLRLCLAASLIALSAGVRADPAPNENWIYLANTEAMQWHIRKGSVVTKTTRGGVPVIYGEMRVWARSDGAIKLQENYVPLADCQRGQGKLKTLNMDGNWLWDNDWATGDGSVAGTISEFLCAVWKRNDNQGI